MKKHKLAAIILTVFCLCSCYAPSSSEGSVHENSSSHSSSPPSSPAPSAADSNSEPNTSSEIEVPSSVQQEKNPFDPFVQIQADEGPVYQIESDGLLSGTWQHYLNPKYTDMPNATYQYIFSDDIIGMSIGTYQTDSGYYFRGSYTFSENGIVNATVSPSYPEMDVNSTGNKEVRVTILVEEQKNRPDFLLFTILEFSGGIDQCSYAFAPIVGQRIPFRSVY